MDCRVRNWLDFVLGEVLLGEITEGRVRIAWGFIVAPGFVGAVSGFRKDVL